MTYRLVLRQIGLSTSASRLLGVSLLISAVFLSAPAVSQAQPPASPAVTASHGTPHHRKSKPAAAAVESPQPVTPEAPAEPPAPDWPVNAKPAPAEVAWNGRDLVVTATNSSLQQILHDVSTATGVKVEGLNVDQRIFGSYGPASSRDVLGQLLDGAGYNLMMVGDLGQGTPRELVLTPKTSIAANANQGQSANSRQDQNDSDAQEEPEPEPPPVVNPRRPNAQFPPPQFGPNRTPQEMMEQMQQRQQQFMNNQQNGQPQLQQPQQPQ